jgi:hypothetical protein
MELATSPEVTMRRPQCRDIIRSGGVLTNRLPQTYRYNVLSITVTL